MDSWRIFRFKAKGAREEQDDNKLLNSEEKSLSFPPRERIGRRENFIA